MTGRCCRFAAITFVESFLISFKQESQIFLNDQVLIGAICPTSSTGISVTSSEYHKDIRHLSLLLLDQSLTVNVASLQIKNKDGKYFASFSAIFHRLPDGTFTDKLKYFKDGKSVCRCMTGNGSSKCNPMDRQTNTLLPWAMVHTGQRNNNWMGCYGRVTGDSYFSTTITLPHPESKQGRVLHPIQVHRHGISKKIVIFSFIVAVCKIALKLLSFCNSHFLF